LVLDSANIESIYDKHFLTRSKVYLSYEAKFYAPTFNLVSLFYKNYLHNKKLFFLFDFVSTDLFSFLKVSVTKKNFRARLTTPRLLRFQSKDIFNLFLLSKGNYGKKVKTVYRTKVRKNRARGDGLAPHYSLLRTTYITNYPMLAVQPPIRSRINPCVRAFRAPCLTGRLRPRQVARLYAARNAFRLKKFTVLVSLHKIKTLVGRSRRYLPTYNRNTDSLAPRLITAYAPQLVNYIYSPGLGVSHCSPALIKVLSRKPGNTYGYTSISSSNSKSFILHYTGLLLLSKLNLKVRLGSHLISTIRKKLYSFLKPNELRFRAFSARRRLTTIKLIRALGKSAIVGRKWLSKSYLYNFFRNRSTGTNAVNVGHVTSSPLFRIPTLVNNNMYYKENFFSFSSSSEGRVRSIKRDVSIERIRFKPGYQRLWRKFRLALAESLNYKYIYQQQLTKYFVKFSRKISQRAYYTHESTLRSVMLYSRLIPDFAMLKMLFSNKVIFLNHRLVLSYLIYIYKNDFIQLEITIWFYIFSKWMLLWTRARNAKFKRLVYRKSLAGKYKVMKQRKQKSHYTPKWIFLVNFDFIDVKPFLEVDYLTLSFFYYLRL